MHHIVDIAYGFAEACSIELKRAPVTWVDRTAQLRMWSLLAIFRPLLWVWQCVVLGLRTPSPNVRPQTILIYLQGMLGDVSVHLPVVRALKLRYPTAEINCVCYSEGFPIAGLLKDLPFFDRLVVVSDHPVVRRGASLVLSDVQLEGLSADLFVNLSPFSNRGVPGFVAREMVFARKLGARFYLGDTLSLYGVPEWSKRAKRLFVRNEPRRGWRVVAPLGVISDGNNEFALPCRTRARGMPVERPSGESSRAYAVVHPGAKHSVKLWPAAYYGQVAAYLQRVHGLDVLITGSMGESMIADQVIQASGNVATNLCGKTSIPEMIELIRGARLVLTNDTGPMHLSGLLNRPTVAIFGTRMTVRNWYPVGDRTTVLMHYHADSFSYDDEGRVPHRMENISPEIVAKEIDKLLCEF